MHQIQVGERLHFSSWALFQEHDGEVFVMDCWSRATGHAFLQSGAVRDLIASVDESGQFLVTRENAETCETLLGCAAIHQAASCPCTLQPSREAVRVAPLWRTRIEVDAFNADIGEQTNQLCRILLQETRSGGPLREVGGVVVCLNGVPPEAAVARASEYISSVWQYCDSVEIPRSRVWWEVALDVNRLGDLQESTGDFLELLGGSTHEARVDLRLNDFSRAASAPRSRPEPDLIAELRRAGMPLLTRIFTNSSDGLVEHAVQSAEENDGVGLSIQPVFVSKFGGVELEPISEVQSVEDFYNALVALAEDPRVRPDAIDPLGDIMRSAVVPGGQRTLWGPQLGEMFLSRSGAVHLSPLHSEVDEWSSSSISYRVWRGSGFDRRPSLSSGAAIDCDACGVRGLCGGYWSPLYEALGRAGRVDLASAVARGDCMLKKSIQQRVLRGMRAAASTRSGVSEYEARFEGGNLQLAASLQSEE